MKEPFPPLSLLGVGSVPFYRGENLCGRIFEEWDIPFWPQYPLRSIRENFVFQFLSHFPGVKASKWQVTFDESAYFRVRNGFRRRLERAFSGKNFLPFEPSPQWALGYAQMCDLLAMKKFSSREIVKLQLTGPATIWESFFSRQTGRNSKGMVRKDLIELLTISGLAQIQRVRQYKKTPLIFIDEPLYSGDPSELQRLVRVFRKEGALVGLHVCSCVDWQGLERVGFDVFHFDLESSNHFSRAQRRFLQKHLKSQKWAAWGVVPTSPNSKFKVRDFSAFLLDRIGEVVNSSLKLGEVLAHSLIAPACGSGTLKRNQDRAVWGSLRETAGALRKGFFRNQKGLDNLNGDCILPASTTKRVEDSLSELYKAGNTRSRK